LQKYYQHPEISKETQGAVVSSPYHRYFSSCYPAAGQEPHLCPPHRPPQCPHTEPPAPNRMAPGDTWRRYRGGQASLSCHPPAHWPEAELRQMKPPSSKYVVRGETWLDKHSSAQLSSCSIFPLHSRRKTETGVEKQFTALPL